MNFFLPIWVYIDNSIGSKKSKGIIYSTILASITAHSGGEVCFFPKGKTEDTIYLILSLAGIVCA